MSPIALEIVKQRSDAIAATATPVPLEEMSAPPVLWHAPQPQPPDSNEAAPNPAALRASLRPTPTSALEENSAPPVLWHAPPPPPPNSNPAAPNPAALRASLRPTPTPALEEKSAPPVLWHAPPPPDSNGAPPPDPAKLRAGLRPTAAAKVWLPPPPPPRVPAIAEVLPSSHVASRPASAAVKGAAATEVAERAVAATEAAARAAATEAPIPTKAPAAAPARVFEGYVPQPPPRLAGALGEPPVPHSPPRRAGALRAQAEPATPPPKLAVGQDETTGDGAARMAALDADEVAAVAALRSDFALRRENLRIQLANEFATSANLQTDAVSERAFSQLADDRCSALPAKADQAARSGGGANRGSEEDGVVLDGDCAPALPLLPPCSNHSSFDSDGFGAQHSASSSPGYSSEESFASTPQPPPPPDTPPSDHST